jgi:hypothetical protein
MASNTNLIHLDKGADLISAHFLPLSSCWVPIIGPDHTTTQPDEVTLGQFLFAGCMRYLTRSLDFAFPSARTNLSADI